MEYLHLPDTYVKKEDLEKFLEKTYQIKLVSMAKKNKISAKDRMKKGGSMENGGEIKISSDVKKLSNEGLLSILQDHDHVKLFGDESRKELQEILQLNLDQDEIDQIEVITVLSGEYSSGGSMANGGNIEEIELDMKQIKDKYPNAKVSYYFAKNPNGKNYVVIAKENGKSVYSSYKSMEKGGEVADIEKYKKQLISKAKSKGLYENFGEKEVRKLQDKYGHTDNISQFDNWAMNFDLSQLSSGGSMKNGGQLNSVKVLFKDPQYNYETSVSASTTEKSAKHYFIGKSFNVGVYPKEQFKKVIGVEYTKGGGSMANGGGIKDVSTPEEFKEWATERKIELIDELDGFHVADKVKYTNENGVTFGPFSIIGIDKDDRFYNRRFYLNKDSYWFPVKSEEISSIKGKMAAGGRVTKGDLLDLIEKNNKEYGTNFELVEAYGQYELWDKNKTRIDAGSRKDIYNAFVKARFSDKYRHLKDGGKASIYGRLADGGAPSNDLNNFVKMLQDKVTAYYVKEFPKLMPPVADEVYNESIIKVKPGIKYTKIDKGNSGLFMLDNESGHLYYIKGYGAIDRKKHFGNIKDIVAHGDFEWDGHSIISKSLYDKGYLTRYGYAGPVIMKDGGKPEDVKQAKEYKTEDREKVRGFKSTWHKSKQDEYKGLPVVYFAHPTDNNSYAVSSGILYKGKVIKPVAAFDDYSMKENTALGVAKLLAENKYYNPYQMQEGGNVSSVLIVGTPEWVERILTQAMQEFTAENITPDLDDFVEYIQDAVEKESGTEIKFPEAKKYHSRYENWKNVPTKELPLPEQSYEFEVLSDNDERARQLFGISLKGSIDATYDDIVKVFGQPTETTTGGASKATWDIVFSDGAVASIYDWNQGDVEKELIEKWNIQAKDSKVLPRIQKILTTPPPPVEQPVYNEGGEINPGDTLTANRTIRYVMGQAADDKITRGEEVTVETVHGNKLQLIEHADRYGPFYSEDFKIKTKYHHGGKLTPEQERTQIQSEDVVLNALLAYKVFLKKSLKYFETGEQTTPVSDSMRKEYEEVVRVINSKPTEYFDEKTHSEIIKHALKYYKKKLDVKIDIFEENGAGDLLKICKRELKDVNEKLEQL